MKRILTFILFALLFLPVEAQIIRANPFYTLPGAIPDFYDEYDTVYAAMTTKPSAEIAGYQNALVYSLDTCDFAGGASVWDRMDVFYVPATSVNTGGEAQIDWFNPGTFDATLVGETPPTFTSLEGFTGTATSSHVSTNWTPSTNAINYALSSASVGIYLRVNESIGNAVYAADGGGYASYLIPRSTTDGMIAKLNSSAWPDPLASLDSRGFFVITRTDITYVNVYKNGTYLDRVACSSDGLPTGVMLLLAVVANQYSVFFAGDEFSAAEITAINTIIETYMDAIGKGVE